MWYKLSYRPTTWFCYFVREACLSVRWNWDIAQDAENNEPKITSYLKKKTTTDTTGSLPVVRWDWNYVAVCFNFHRC